MDYDKLDDLRKSASIDMSPPEMHGGICSQICFKSDHFEEFIPYEKSDDGSSVSVQIRAYRKALLRIIETDAKRLEDGDLDFKLILPEETSSIQERAEALSIWCQGFIDGVGFLLTESNLKTLIRTKILLYAIEAFHMAIPNFSQWIFLPQA